VGIPLKMQALLDEHVNSGATLAQRWRHARLA
jgi:hypothetical protein